MPHFEFFGFQADLSRLLERSVDLVEERAVRNPYVLANITARGSSFMQHDSRAYLWDVRQTADAILEHRRVWRAIQESLPPLRAKLAALLDELGPP